MGHGFVARGRRCGADDQDITCRKGLRRHEGGGADQGCGSGTEDSFHDASPFGWCESTIAI
jgi:hypothetical protein